MLVFLLFQHHELFLHLDEIHVDVYGFDRNVQKLNKINIILTAIIAFSYILLVVIDELNQNPNVIENFDKLKNEILIRLDSLIQIICSSIFYFV